MLSFLPRCMGGPGVREHAGESQIPTSFAGTNRSRFEGLRLVPHSQRLCLAAGRSPVVHHEPTHRGRSSPSWGSDHLSEGSDWYLDGGLQPPEVSVKFLLPGLGVERSVNIGFRVCWDLR